MTQPNPMTRLEELTLRLLDEQIDQAGLSELENLLHEDSAQATFMSLLKLESSLRVPRVQLSQRVIDALHRERSMRVEHQVMQRLHTESPPTQHRPFRRIWQTGLLASCVLSFLLGLVIWSNTTAKDTTLGTLTRDTSGVQVFATQNDDQPLPMAGNSLSITSGNVITSANSDDAAMLLFVDGSEVRIPGESRLVIEAGERGQKILTLLSGVIQAHVEPQPAGRPMQIHTSTAYLEVLGTSLDVNLDNEKTELAVLSGRVAMTRRTDGSRIEVETGEFARSGLDTSVAFVPMKLPELSRTWDQDFLDGPPSHWETGSFDVVDGRTVMRAHEEALSANRFYAVMSQNAWNTGEHGLFQLDDESLISVTFRVDKPAKVRFMITARSYPLAKHNRGLNFFYEENSWRRDDVVGLWQTITVPMKEFNHYFVTPGVDFAIDSSLNDYAAFRFQVSTMNVDAGLVVDRIQILNPDGARRTQR